MSQGDVADEVDESWAVIAWVPTDNSDRDELVAKVKQLQTLALLERERIFGLSAQLATAETELNAMKTTPIGEAFRRIDKLEDQREQLLHKLRLGKFGEETDDEVAALKASATWRAGRLILAPAIFLKSKTRQR
ncbi:hypothetical protein ACX3O0_00575 [Homoserinimonas sp. A447]